MAAADISGQNRKKRDVGNDSRGEAVVAAAPSAKKAKRSGPESSRKQKRRTIPKIQLDESRERAEMASAERDRLRFENQLLNESQSAKGEALLGLSHSFTPHVRFHSGKCIPASRQCGIASASCTRRTFNISPVNGIRDHQELEPSCVHRISATSTSTQRSTGKNLQLRRGVPQSSTSTQKKRSGSTT